jgi:peptidoglycan LD-endopeptidase LytH
LAAALVVGLSTMPSRADTASDFRAARARLGALQTDLDRLAASYAAAETEFAQTETRMEEVSARVARLHDRMRAIRERLQIRAWEAYEGSGTNALELLLTSESFSQFSDRVEFLGTVVQGDQDLMIQAQVTREELRRSQADLESLSARQSATVASLGQQKVDIASKMAEAQRAQADLERKLADERAAAAAAASVRTMAAGAPVHSGGALQSCPVGQPRTFVDTFGAPRPGGRTHQGIDLMAPYGTPVYAAQSGRFEHNYNSLGGTSALLYAGNGDYTYYAHMSSYAGVGNGATVPAGTMIGHVGNTGDAAGGPMHQHFEYHPGGGGAVDPYAMLRAVCG